MNSQTRYVVHYLKGYGRAEPIRFLLSHAGIDFTEAYHSWEELPKLHEEGVFEFGQVPVLEDNGKFYA